MGKKVSVVTDTIASVPQELVEKYDISIVPFHIIWGGKDYGEVGVDREQFRSWNRNRENLPMTSAPSIGEILEVWRGLVLRGDDVLHVAMSSGMSMEYSIALQAKSLVQGESSGVDIGVIDSHSSQAAQMFVVLEAARAAAEGKSLSEVIEVANSMIQRVRQLYLLDSLHNLVEGGRGDKARSWEAAALSMKPLLELGIGTRGLMMPLARARTKARGIDKILEIVGGKVENRKLHVGVTVGDVPDEADDLKERIMSRFQCVEFYLIDGSIVADVHDGQGALRLGFYGED